MEIKDISFPVYPIRPHRRIFRGSKGAVFIETEFGEINIIDDRSIEGSFSFRRLKLSIQLTHSKDFKLYPLNRSYNNLGTLVKMRIRHHAKKFIDSNGTIFEYKPVKFYRLSYHRIVERYIVEGKCGVVKLRDINSAFKIAKLPPDNMKWAGIIHSDTGYLLYEFSSEQLPDTRKKL